MNLEYVVYWSWEKKVLYDENFIPACKIELDNINKNNEYSFYFLNKKQVKCLFKHSILNFVSPAELDKTYRKSVLLNDYYNKLFSLCKEKNINKVIFSSTWQYWHPDFLSRLKDNWIDIYLTTADDDNDSIKYCSLPYTKHYKIHFHVWVMFDKNWKTIADILREHWWNPIWIPLWARADHINENIKYVNRDIEVCYIWNVNPHKLFRLSRLKRHFWDRFKLYWWQWNWDFKSFKWLLYKIANKLFRLWNVEPISDSKLLEIYRRTKIWFNMHLIPWKWPSNSRMYELPCNWVMQLCDNELWLSRVFEIWKEIVWYSDINDAISKIEYYLKHDEERISIAKAGHERAIREYKLEIILRNIYKLIFN